MLSNLLSHAPESKQQLNVKEFFKGKHVLLTGATGFLGKVLLEKMLRTFTEIGSIFVMIRAKKGKTPM